MIHPHTTKMHGNAQDLAGQRFGRLVAVSRHGRQWLWKCDCGNEKLIHTGNVKAGKTVSCGCRMKETARERCLSHGHKTRSATSAEYRSWSAAKNRCSNPNHKAWDDYGGRGIAMCEEWSNSFEKFLEEMGEKPPGTSLDRYPDNSGNYRPGNCRWATPKEQAQNRRPLSKPTRRDPTTGRFTHPNQKGPNQ